MAEKSHIARFGAWGVFTQMRLRGWPSRLLTAMPPIRVEPSWLEVLDVAVARRGNGRVGVLDRTGSGKWTLVAWLGRQLAGVASAGRLDADPG